jgi:high-affinity iron transporter
MLINTVLLFLQNVLPIFIITTLLLLRFSSISISNINIKWLAFSLLFVTFSAFTLSKVLEDISQIADGRGIELLLSSGFLLVYISSIGLYILNNIQRATFLKVVLALIIFFIISCLNGAHFIVYLTGYWAKAKQVESMFIGIILGGGVSLSISILFYFLLKYTDQNIHSNTSNYFLLFFTIGQLIHAVALLQQVDLLPSSQPIWDSGKLITENSELGQLLTVLFGYETTPSPLQLITYTVALFIPVVIGHYKTILLLFSGERS